MNHDEIREALKLHHDLPKEYRQIGDMLSIKEKHLSGLLEDRDRLERNRDMWKAQCERQAEMLTALRAAASLQETK